MQRFFIIIHRKPKWSNIKFYMKLQKTSKTARIKLKPIHKIYINKSLKTSTITNRMFWTLKLTIVHLNAFESLPNNLCVTRHATIVFIIIHGNPKRSNIMFCRKLKKTLSEPFKDSMYVIKPFNRFKDGHNQTERSMK